MICPADCGPCNTCGDAKCNGGLGETCMTCPFDCGPCPGGNCAHNKCEVGAPLDPACDPCVTFICAFDDVCCTQTWDDICVSYVEGFCGEMCP
jgi:hypothetical protein